MLLRIVLGALLVITPPAFAAIGQSGKELGDWTSYRNAKHGFMLAYPTALFAPDPERESEDGRAVVSTDGRARLLVGAFVNQESTDLKAYREFLLAESYSGATLDYAPVRDKWFILSGLRGNEVFYERVTFTCGGRIINSWAMLYPVSERRTYDRVVERVAKSYSPGAGARGDCE